MGLSTLPAVGTGESLGPTKRNRALQTPDATRDIDAGEWNAAAVALEGVCAEVGLSNGSTSGSLVARVAALEGAAAAEGDVTGPEGATAGNIPTLDATGKILADSGVAIGSIASAASAASAAQTDATQALSDAADALAATTHLTIREETTNTVVGGGQAGERLLMRVSGSDLIVTLADTATAGQRSEVVRTFAPGADPGGDVIIQGVDGDHQITGPTRIGRKGGTLEVALLGIDGSTYYWLITGPPMPRAPATHTSATLTLAESDRDNVIRVSAASNAVAVQIPDTLPGADSDTSDVWECTLIVTDATTNGVTISTGAGLLTPVYYGASTITVDNTLVAISVVRGVAYVAIVEPA